MITLMTVAVLSGLLAQDAAPTPPVPPGEKPVKPYEITNENAGATPYKDDRYFIQFGGVEGLSRISDTLVQLLIKDARVEGIFRASDLVRLHRLLKEQFCYLLGGPCDYTGMNMRASHKDHGITMREYLILVEHLQVAMEREKVPFTAQSKLLAKLAPLYRDIVRR